MQRKSEELQLAVQEYLDVDWTHVKFYLRRQIAKCVQECKSQATNAKRIAKTLKPSHGSKTRSTESNDGYEYDYDSDDWGSDFEDSDDEIKNEESFEVNNNSINLNSADAKSSSSESQTNSEKSIPIPQPPDIPVISKATNGSPRLRNFSSNSIGRPPLKRPPSQPPPPPTQATSHEEPQEEYEIPIASSSTSVKSVSSSSLASNENFVIETYELIDPNEEHYEIVDTHIPPKIMCDKPILPPRHVKSPKSVSPPPLPQKPPYLKENLTVERTEGVRTFSRPKLSSNENPTDHASTLPMNVSLLNSLMGRRPSQTDVMSFASSISPPKEDLKKPLPPLPPRGNVDETGQNQILATRPLPPVPFPNGANNFVINTEDIHTFPWFHEMERDEAETTVQKLNESGSFVVRPSKRAGKENPYSVTVLHEGKLFHLNIRQRSDNTFALGKEKEKEKAFSSVAELIAYHQNDPILLKNKGEPAGKTILKKYPEKT